MSRKYMLQLLAVGIIAIAILLVSGCVDHNVSHVDENLNESQLRDYFEFEYLGLDNSTTYYLSTNESMKTVIYVTDVTGINVTAQSDMMSNEPLIKNIFAMTVGGEVVNVNNSTSKAFGQTTIDLRFDDKFTGFIAYTEKNYGGRHFTHVVMEDGFVRVVLPTGYSTGNPVIGIVRPSGYNISVIRSLSDSKSATTMIKDTEDADRVAVIWNNPYSASKAVIVNYYPDNAPAVITISVLLLAFFALCVMVWYRISMKRLKSRQEGEIKI